MMRDEEFMRLALELAKQAAEEGEVPVGAVVVQNGKVIGRGYNRRESLCSVVHHAECAAIEEAAKAIGSWRLNDCTLYVTLEPCPMCAGAVINARLPRVVFGTRDEDKGACVSRINLFELGFGFIPAMREGVLQQECAALLQQFFAEVRDQKKE